MKKLLLKFAVLICAFLFAMPVISGCEFLFGEQKPPVTEKPGTDDENPDNPNPDEPTYKLPALKADGANVVDEEGNEVILRGINAGGLFVTEHWMTGFVYSKTIPNDYRGLTQKFIERFGEDKTKALWAEYRANWWSEEDFQNIADMGMNVIRLPFTYMNVDFAAVTDYAKAGKNYDFTALDEFVNKAADYGIYTILDLHGAYGSQNGQDHSGQSFGTVEEVTFYSNEQYISLTEKLWGAIAEHYKDNPHVAGYDLLNEPGEKAEPISKKHWDVLDRFYDAVRAKDNDHIVIIESCWDAWNLPQPTQYGWENCMYSFHHYADDKLSPSDYFKSWDDKLNSIKEANFGVPLQMGEFTNYQFPENWSYTMTLMKNNGWHWTSWTYKVWGNMAWGVVNIRGNDSDKVNALTDSYDQILEKFKKLKSSQGVKYTFGNGKTLEDVFKGFLKP